MKKRKLLVIPFLSMSLCVFSQNISHDAIASQGDFSQNEHMSLEWTLGETFSESLFTSNKIFTQGFQQPYLKISRDYETASTKLFDIVLFPNPVDAFLHVDIKTIYHSNITVSMFDVSGNFIKQVILLETDIDKTLDVKELPTGVYLLKFTNKNGTLLETHRIIKY